MDRQHRWRGWRKDEGGVAAVEFALLFLPFMTILLATIELSFYYATASVLEGASASAARLIRTGQVQMSADPEVTFRDELCDKVAPILQGTCDEIQYEVIRVSANSFADAEGYEPQFDEDGNLIPSGFSTGNSNDVVLIRAVRQHSFLTPYIGSMLSPQGNGRATQISTVVLKAEPYQFGEE